MNLEAQGQAKAANVGDFAPVRCQHSRMAEIGSLRPNPKNPNRHDEHQLRLLAACIGKQGWRAPIVVSKQSGFVVVGHGRLEAAKLLGLKVVPIDEQDFETPELELAHLIADNRLAELAEISLPDLKNLLQELDTGLMPMELTGFTDEALAGLMTQVAPVEEVTLAETKCPKCGYLIAS